MNKTSKEFFNWNSIKTILKLLTDSFFKRKGRIIALLAISFIFFIVTTWVINGIVWKDISKTASEPLYSGIKENDYLRYNAAVGAISTLMGGVYVPIFLIVLGVFLTSFKESHLFKRIMISKINKKDVLASYWIFTLIFTFVGFLFFVLLNMQWIVVASTYKPQTEIVNLFKDQLEIAGIRVKDPKLLESFTYVLNPANSDGIRTVRPSFGVSFSILSFLIMGVVYTFSLSGVLIFAIGISKRQSAFTFMFLAVVFIIPGLYNLIGRAAFDGFGENAKEVPIWFRAIYPINGSYIGTWFTENLLTADSGTLEFIAKNPNPSPEIQAAIENLNKQGFKIQQANMFLALLIPAVTIPGYIYLGNRYWDWKDK